MFDAAALLGDGAPPDPAQMMQDMAASDPRMAMLMQMMQAQRGPAVEDPDVPDERDELIAELSERLDAAEARLTKMTRIARQLHETSRAAMLRMSELAAALGACGLCWGEDSTCLGCRGRGRPGMIRPDPEMRAHLFGAQPPVRDACGHTH